MVGNGSLEPLEAMGGGRDPETKSIDIGKLGKKSNLRFLFCCL